MCRFVKYLPRNYGPAWVHFFRMDQLVRYIPLKGCNSLWYQKVTLRIRELNDSSPPCKGIRISGKFCLWNGNSGLLECGIQLKDPGIPLVIRMQNLISANKESGIQYLGSEIHSVESRSQDCLPLHGRDSPHLAGLY